MYTTNRITQLFNIQYPILQAGMIWCSGWELASAVSNAGALGIIGAGSMYPEQLRTHIIKCQAATNKPFAVNLPLLYPNVNEALLLFNKLPLNLAEPITSKLKAGTDEVSPIFNL